MAKKRATLTDLFNDLTFKTLFDKYRLIAINAFQWDGLPDGIEERHIETRLFEQGKALFFRDPGMSYMTLQGDPGKGQNVYGDPLEFIATGHNYRRVLPSTECVLIENNKLQLCTRDFVMFYVAKMAEAERTLDVNIKSCKTPVIFACDDKDLLSFKRIFHEVDGNTPALFVDRGLNLDGITAFQTGVKFLGNDLSDYLQTVENKLLTFLGCNNNPVDKKERVNTLETRSNDQLIDSFSQLQLEARERACERINDMYGLSLSVKRREKKEEVNPDEPLL